MPRMTTCVLGRALTSLPLPSFVTSTIEPVSATAKFAPVTPTSAVSNTARSCRRAVAVSFSSSGRSSLPSTAPRRAATSTAVFSIAGAMMWAGCSPASWRMYSPRSVSTTRSPSRSSASFRRISREFVEIPIEVVDSPLLDLAASLAELLDVRQQSPRREARVT